MARKKWDAIVIGAGPAGASAARTLVAGGLDCLLIEKKKLPRHKMCSGILSRWTIDFVHRKFGAIPREVGGSGIRSTDSAAIVAGVTSDGSHRSVS